MRAIIAAVMFSLALDPAVAAAGEPVTIFVGPEASRHFYAHIVGPVGRRLEPYHNNVGRVVVDLLLGPGDYSSGRGHNITYEVRRGPIREVAGFRCGAVALRMDGGPWRATYACAHPAVELVLANRSEELE